MGADSLHLCLLPECNEHSARDTHPDPPWSLPGTKPPSSPLPGAFPSLDKSHENLKVRWFQHFLPNGHVTVRIACSSQTGSRRSSAPSGVCVRGVPAKRRGLCWEHGAQCVHVPLEGRPRGEPLSLPGRGRALVNLPAASKAFLEGISCFFLETPKCLWSTCGE